MYPSHFSDNGASQLCGQARCWGAAADSKSWWLCYFSLKRHGYMTSFPPTHPQPSQPLLNTPPPQSLPRPLTLASNLPPSPWQ